MTRTIELVLCIVMCAGRAHAVEPINPRGHEQYLQGFAKDVSGEVLSYWNFHPFAKRSLLTRCTTGKMAIVWRTQELPPPGTRDTLSFLWIGAYSTGTSTADHEFDFYVNGEKALTFQTRKGGRYDNWSIPGRRGVVLQYRHVWEDHVNDAHGYFILKVPATSFPSSQPLTIKVVGQRAESRDWYMTFMHAFRDSAVIRPLPILVREGGALRQPIEIGVDSPAGTGRVAIELDGGAAVIHELTLGWNSVMLSVPAVDTARSVPLTVSINDGLILSRTARVSPVRHRTIWLLPHSHNDIGYSDIQTTVLDIQIQNIRDALQLIEKTREYPDGARFKWNMEILWPVESFLARAGPRDREAFLRAVRNGDIGLNALYVNPLTGIARPEALIRLTDYARELERDYGVEIPVAMVSDIPGFVWSIVPALAQAGVRYFTSGPNSGDRIGHYTEALGDKPFYWVGPSGRDSVLFWVAGTGYSLFHATRTMATNRKFLQQLQEYLEHLDAVDYPYDIVQMRYSVYSDNGMTDSTLSTFVQNWNASYGSPTICIGTTEGMFDAFENEYGSLLPSMAGDITPYWEDGAASTAAELGIAERATERLVQAEIVTSLCAPNAFDRKAFADAWDAINLWNEHTWGAWNSVSDPDHAGAVAQWRIKQGFALQTESLSQELLRRQTESVSPYESSFYEVINTSTWPRTDLVFLSVEESATGDRVVTEWGELVPSQRLTDGRLAVLARSVPALGSLRFTVSSGLAKKTSGLIINGLTMQNQSLRVTVDSATGSIQSVCELSTGREFVLADGDGINSLIFVSGVDPRSRVGDQPVRVRIGEKGPLIASLVSESSPPGVQKATREIFLVDGAEHIDIRNTLEKTPVREKEAVYFGFECSVPEAVSRLDLGWGFIQPERDQLPGSCKDFFSVQRWVDISNDQSGITWTTGEAPLLSLGGLVDERHHNDGPGGWKTRTASSALLYSWVMNNYWHTNYKADQEGISVFHYSLRPHQGFDPVEAYRFGIERNQPLIRRRVKEGDRPAKAPFVFRSRSIAITTILPAPEGAGFLVRLYNPSTDSSLCELGPTEGASLRTFESSARGERGRELSGAFTLGPLELRTIRLE